MLVLEDEFLIAMDVEQICRDHGASDVAIRRTLAEALEDGNDYDAAIIDVMLASESTLPFAQKLAQKGLPFIFASGYTESSDISTAFPGVAMVSKPYSEGDIIEALAAAIRRNSDQG